MRMGKIRLGQPTGRAYQQTDLFASGERIEMGLVFSSRNSQAIEKSEGEGQEVRVRRLGVNEIRLNS
jgi:hypothetical protein